MLKKESPVRFRLKTNCFKDFFPSDNLVPKFAMFLCNKPILFNHKLNFRNQVEHPISQRRVGDSGISQKLSKMSLPPPPYPFLKWKVTKFPVSINLVNFVHWKYLLHFVKIKLPELGEGWPSF